MQATIDRLSEALPQRYLLYLETVLVELVSEHGSLEFRRGFTLRGDHKLRTCRYGASATEWSTDMECQAIATAVFDELEQFIDEVIAGQLQDAN